MAKKDKDTIYAEFLADLKAINPQVEEILKDEKVSTKLRESVLARADYSQSMDELKKAQDDMRAYLSQERTKIEGWYKWYGDTSATFAAQAEELKRYKDEFGDLDDAGQRRVAKSQGLSVEDFEKKLNEEISKRESAYLKFANDLTDIKMEHFTRFKEKLDVDAVYKIAAEKQMALDAAYRDYTSERNEELNKKDLEAKLAAAREEGAKEALAKHNLPVISSDSALTHVLDIKDAGKTQNDRVAAAMAAFGQKR